MVKVSITLPNNAQITFESEEPEIIHQVVGMVLRDLPRDLMQVSHGDTGNGNGTIAPGQGNSVEIPLPLETSADSPATIHVPGPPTEYTNVPDAPDGPAPDAQLSPGPDLQPLGDRFPDPPAPDRRKAEQAARSAAAELAFIHYCQSANPIGDMRKVVVAAEGAAQFLEMVSVSAEDLEELFERVGWLQPHNFTQTLRNAARTKFRWLERVPGRSGHYAVTELGRTKTLNN